MAGAVLAVGTGIQAYSSIQQGMDKQQSFEFQAQARRAQAAQSQLAANREIGLISRNADITAKAQTAAFGQSGVTMSGSTLSQLEETARTAREEIFSTQQAANYRSQTMMADAGYDMIEAGQANNMGYINATSSVLTGAGSYMKNYSSGPRTQTAGV